MNGDNQFLHHTGEVNRLCYNYDLGANRDRKIYSHDHDLTAVLSIVIINCDTLDLFLQIQIAVAGDIGLAGTAIDNIFTLQVIFISIQQLTVKEDLTFFISEQGISPVLKDILAYQAEEHIIDRGKVGLSVVGCVAGPAKAAVVVCSIGGNGQHIADLCIAAVGADRRNICKEAIGDLTGGAIELADHSGAAVGADDRNIFQCAVQGSAVADQQISVCNTFRCGTQVNKCYILHNRTGAKLTEYAAKILIVAVLGGHIADHMATAIKGALEAHAGNIKCSLVAGEQCECLTAGKVQISVQNIVAVQSRLCSRNGFQIFHSVDDLGSNGQGNSITYIGVCAQINGMLACTQLGIHSIQQFLRNGQGAVSNGIALVYGSRTVGQALCIAIQACCCHRSGGCTNFYIHCTQNLICIGSVKDDNKFLGCSADSGSCNYGNLSAFLHCAVNSQGRTADRNAGNRFLQCQGDAALGSQVGGTADDCLSLRNIHLLGDNRLAVKLDSSIFVSNIAIFPISNDIFLIQSSKQRIIGAVAGNAVIYSLVALIFRNKLTKLGVRNNNHILHCGDILNRKTQIVNARDDNIDHRTARCVHGTRCITANKAENFMCIALGRNDHIANRTHHTAGFAGKQMLVSSSAIGSHIHKGNITDNCTSQDLAKEAADSSIAAGLCCQVGNSMSATVEDTHKAFAAIGCVVDNIFKVDQADSRLTGGVNIIC